MRRRSSQSGVFDLSTDVCPLHIRKDGVTIRGAGQARTVIKYTSQSNTGVFLAIGK